MAAYRLLPADLAVVVAATAIWAAGLGALLLRSPTSLSVIRSVAPVALANAVVLAARSESHLHARALSSALAITAAALALVMAYSADTGRHFVQGSAYGAEQRFPLRLPAALLVPLGLAGLIWTTLAALPVALERSQRTAATVVNVAALAIGAFLWPRVHRFAQRWLVVLPTAVVVHDALVLSETLMIGRRGLAGASLAPADTEALDLTGPASGNAIELRLVDAPTVLLRAATAKGQARAVHAKSVLVAPSRPGAALTAIHASR